MHFTKILVAATAVTFAVASNWLVEASPVPKAVDAYVPMSERKFSAEEIAHHEGLFKRTLPGVNNWNCRLTPTHPRPLILVHGLLGNEDTNFKTMGPRFVKAGYCVYSLTYGQLPGIPMVAGIDLMENSAQQLATFVDKVLAAFNTTQVDLVGHSEGSLMPRYYLRFLGGGPKVHKFGAFSAISYGTTLQGLVPLMIKLNLFDPITKVLDPICKVCTQFVEGSPFLTKLNEGSDTVPGVQYRFLITKKDEIVTPPESGFLRDNNPLVENLVLQDICFFDQSSHNMAAMDPIVFHVMDAFFNPEANQKVTCMDFFN
ncbi:hypothetical protein BG003_010128 [Podila horticola]|nr:hypothetical protein BG003_010128 [Podila horticola]